jgi:hypothetical protein
MYIFSSLVIFLVALLVFFSMDLFSDSTLETYASSGFFSWLVPCDGIDVEMTKDAKIYMLRS